MTLRLQPNAYSEAKQAALLKLLSDAVETTLSAYGESSNRVAKYGDKADSVTKAIKLS